MEKGVSERAVLGAVFWLVLAMAGPVWAQEEEEPEVPARSPSAASSGGPAVPVLRAAPSVATPVMVSAQAPAVEAGGQDALRQRLEELERGLAAQGKRLEEQSRGLQDGSLGLVRGTIPREDQEPRPWRLAPRGLLLTGYVQAQAERSQASQDQLQQGDTPLNQDRFLVRRARVRLSRTWQYTAVNLEIDGNTTRGTTFGLRRAEGSVFYRPEQGDGPPLVMFTLGLSEIPFGFEMVDQARTRVFMERSAASLAFFPSEPDLGARISGGIGFVRYAVAFMNGEPLDDRPGRYPVDPNAHKDLVARVGAELEPAERWRFSGGTSILRGKGFHAGTSAGKNLLVWRDTNENAVVDQGEVSGVPGVGATPSENFERWAVGLDARVRWRSPLGWTAVWGEVTLASNLDRGYLPADPILTGLDIRHFGYYAAISQELGRYGLVALRYDVYDPNSDFLERRVGKLIPSSVAVRTFSPAVGAVLPGQGRLILQADIIRDALARDERGVPTDLKNNRLTLRLQVEL